MTITIDWESDKDEHERQEIRLLRTLVAQSQEQIRLLKILVIEDRPPYLKSITLSFLKGSPMPTPGPVTLTAQGQTVQIVIVGLDQFGQPWIGPLPTVTYTDGNASVATTDANGLVTAQANGIDDVHADLTTAEGVALSASAQVIVDIPVEVPVLSQISLQFA